VAPFVDRSGQKLNGALAGILLVPGDKKYMAIASNGSQMAIVKVQGDLPYPETQLVSIPLVKAAVLAAGSTLKVQGISYSSLAGLSFGSTTIAARLIQAAYPDWESIAAAPREGMTTIMVEQLRPALTRALLVEHLMGGITFQSSNGILSLSGRGITGSSIQDQILVEGEEAGPTNLDPKLLLSILQRTTAGTVVISLGNGKRPCWVEEPEHNGKQSQFLLSPIFL